MTLSVNVTSSPQQKTDFLAIARESFGEALPDWVEVMAIEATRTSATSVAQRLAYSVAVISSVCRAKYAGDLGKVEARVRGVFMGELVDCPVLGEIGRSHCLDEQAKKHVGTSATRTALFRACRAGCANSRLKLEGTAA